MGFLFPAPLPALRGALSSPGLPIRCAADLWAQTQPHIEEDQDVPEQRGAAGRPPVISPAARPARWLALLGTTSRSKTFYAGAAPPEGLQAAAARALGLPGHSSVTTRRYQVPAEYANRGKKSVCHLPIEPPDPRSPPNTSTLPASRLDRARTRSDKTICVPKGKPVRKSWSRAPSRPSWTLLSGSQLQVVIQGCLHVLCSTARKKLPAGQSPPR